MKIKSAANSKLQLRIKNPEEELKEKMKKWNPKNEQRNMGNNRTKNQKVIHLMPPDIFNEKRPEENKKKEEILKPEIKKDQSYQISYEILQLSFLREKSNKDEICKILVPGRRIKFKISELNEEKMQPIVSDYKEGVIEKFEIDEKNFTNSKLYLKLLSTNDSLCYQIFEFIEFHIEKYEAQPEKITPQIENKPKDAFPQENNPPDNKKVFFLTYKNFRNLKKNIMKQ